MWQRREYDKKNADVKSGKEGGQKKKEPKNREKENNNGKKDKGEIKQNTEDRIRRETIRTEIEEERKKGDESEDGQWDYI